GDANSLSAKRRRPRLVAPSGWLLARIHLYRRAAAPGGQPLRARTRQRGPCAGRVLRYRIVQSEDSGHRRTGDVTRALPLRACVVLTRASARAGVCPPVAALVDDDNGAASVQEDILPDRYGYGVTIGAPRGIRPYRGIEYLFSVPPYLQRLQRCTVSKL